jgi:hypothetical protein
VTDAEGCAAWPGVFLTCEARVRELLGWREVIGDVLADVGIRFPAAANAMFIAVSIEVILAPSMRVKERRCVCASTTAMLLSNVSL